jgi:hypothetical protein
MITGKKITIIDVSDWDNLIRTTYGKTYRFQQQDGCKDRHTFYFSVPVDERFETIDDIESHLPDSIPEVVNGNEMEVKFQSWLSKDSNLYPEGMDEFWRRLFWSRNFYPNFNTIVNDLYTRGFIEAGEYGINIDW